MSKGLPFSISINIAMDFSFSIETKEFAAQKVVKFSGVKKTSPSTKRRNEKRLREFIEKKSSCDILSSDMVMVECHLPTADIMDIGTTSSVSVDSPARVEPPLPLIEVKDVDPSEGQNKSLDWASLPVFPHVTPSPPPSPLLSPSLLSSCHAYSSASTSALRVCGHHDQEEAKEG